MYSWDLKKKKKNWIMLFNKHSLVQFVSFVLQIINIFRIDMNHEYFEVSSETILLLWRDDKYSLIKNSFYERSNSDNVK